MPSPISTIPPKSPAIFPPTSDATLNPASDNAPPATFFNPAFKILVPSPDDSISCDAAFAAFLPASSAIVPAVSTIPSSPTSTGFSAFWAFFVVISPKRPAVLPTVFRRLVVESAAYFMRPVENLPAARSSAPALAISEPAEIKPTVEPTTLLPSVIP